MVNGFFLNNVWDYIENLAFYLIFCSLKMKKKIMM